MPIHDHQERFHEGIRQFNARQFFDAHETWEEIWLRLAEPDKAFLQGIIQIAAAFHHYLRGNTRGAQSLLEAALRRLEAFPAAHGGIALDRLRSSARRWTAALAKGDDPGQGQLPRIELPNEG